MLRMTDCRFLKERELNAPIKNNNEERFCVNNLMMTIHILNRVHHAGIIMIPLLFY